MKNKNVIRFVESFVLLPVLTMSSVGNLPPDSIQTQNTPEIVSSIKQNIEARSLFAFNQVIDDQAQKEKEDQILKAKAGAIDDYFRKYDMPLEGLGMKMVIEAEKNSLDWRLIPAISVIESTGGKFACKKVTHSFLGWGSCRINFESKEKAIEIIALNLGGGNPKTARYYQKDMSLMKLLETYNPPSVVPNYASKVMKVMEAIGTKEISLQSSNILEINA